ncbi:PC-esterase domain-containing protein 1A-like [Eucyclogobius newberryi]|uniref:PC-esterase domain-containing protein 1A-like n=1 Tax=Eucyclogobius newberryi TaxID=166745 RepID=UPI003B5C6FF6
MRSFVRAAQVKTLLHNKCVVVLGGSVQRSMYKDLVQLLQTDTILTLAQLKSKGEHSFERDRLLEGGRLGLMSNGTDYREVRQYQTEHHLLRFYFITRVYSPYMQSVLQELRQGLRPDVIIVSSCVWDMTRYGLNCLEKYKENLHRFFGQIKSVVCPDGLIVWTLAMPLAKQIKGGFLVPEVSHLEPSLCSDIIEANFYGGQLADAYGLDTLDLHFHFRLSLQHRMPDGVHWDSLAHRSISTLLLLHVAQAWGIILKVDHSTLSLPAPPPPVSVSKRKIPRRKAKWIPPPPPMMGPGPGHAPWCPPHRPHRPPGPPFWGPRPSFPGPAFRMHPFPRPPPPRRMMAPPHPFFRHPPPDWGPMRGGWRRANNRMHPYYPPGPRPHMWGW